MRCPSCGFANLEETRFCIKCGVSLKNRCPTCGSENPPQAKFCGDCGTSLTRQSPAPKPKSKIRRTSLWVYGTAGGLIVLALLIGGLWYRSQQQAEKERPSDTGAARKVLREETHSDTAPTRTVLTVSVGAPDLKHFAMSGTVGLYFGATDERWQPVEGLKPENVEVWEDRKKVELVDFRGEEHGRPVDIVVVFDITESMGPFIEGMKEATMDFADRLAKVKRDYRLGLVTFEDYVVREEPTFTRSAKEFKGWIGALRAKGGGDIPEDSLDALLAASRFPFQPEAQRVVILITDAPNHSRGDGSERTNPYRREVTKLTVDEVITALKRANLSVYAVVPPPFVAPDLHKILQATAGRFYHIVNEGRHFPELISEIGGSIASQHFLTYVSPRPVKDRTRREVSLGIAYGGREGEGSTSYQAWSKGSDETRVKAEKEEKDRTLSPPSPEEKRREEEADRLALIRERSKKPLELLTFRFLNTTKTGKPLSAPAETFPASKTRFIAWEVVFRNRLHDLLPAYHRVEATYYSPKGQLLGTVVDRKEVSAATAEVTFTARLGNSRGGAFVPGTYRVDFYVDGRLLTSRQFQVKDDR